MLRLRRLCNYFHHQCSFRELPKAKRYLRRELWLLGARGKYRYNLFESMRKHSHQQ